VVRLKPDQLAGAGDADFGAQMGDGYVAWGHQLGWVLVFGIMPACLHKEKFYRSSGNKDRSLINLKSLRL
jgi:hypothetical protein